MTLAREEVFGPYSPRYPQKIWITRWRSPTISRSVSRRPSRPAISRAPSISSTRWSRPSDGQSAERRCRVSTPFRWDQGFQLRSKGTGTCGPGILQRLQDRLPEVLIATAFASAADLRTHGAGKIPRYCAEKLLRRALRKAGLRFRSCDTKLPGKPDFLLSARRLAILWTATFGMGVNGRLANTPLSKGSSRRASPATTGSRKFAGTWLATWRTQRPSSTAGASLAFGKPT